MSSELHFWGKQLICMQIFILPGKLYQRSWQIIQLIPWFQMGKATGMMHLIQMCLCAHQFSLVWLFSPFPSAYAFCWDGEQWMLKHILKHQRTWYKHCGALVHTRKITSKLIVFGLKQEELLFTHCPTTRFCCTLLCYCLHLHICNTLTKNWIPFTSSYIWYSARFFW